MFSFRKLQRPKREGSEDSPQLKSSPSLPSLPTQGLAWPENLVDVAAIRDDPGADTQSVQGATKTSFQGVDSTPVSFHKPFRSSPGSSVKGEGHGRNISSLYMSNPPSSFDIWRSNKLSAPAHRPSQRRTRQPPTFNLMVVGGLGTGKTSFLRLLLETADISPTATPEQRIAMDRFLNGGTKRTSVIQTACVEICESRFDRVLLSVIDTPGLDFSDGRELRLERQVAGVIKYLDTQYADTMSEESKVVRQSKGDQHIHLCVYMIDPSSLMSASSRQARYAPLAKMRTRSRSEAASPQPTVDGTKNTNADESDDESAEILTMSPAEIRVIRLLSARANVLPVIARADSLTDEKLSAVKDTVRKDLKVAGLDFGVFGPAKSEGDELHKTINGNGNGHANGNGEANGHVAVAEDSDEDDEPEERQSRPVIKLRPTRHANVSRSRSRRDLKSAAETEGRSVQEPDRESIANVRFSAQIVGRTDLSTLLPFALIAPEEASKAKRAEKPKSRPESRISARPESRGSGVSNYSSAVEDPEEHDTVTQILHPMSPSSMSTRGNFPSLPGPPEDLKGVFTRKFRWGTVDVLDPNHCDFAALRTAVLSTHVKVLKTRTREVLYEKYRTEKLLAWRATRNIDQEETKRMLDALEI